MRIVILGGGESGVGSAILAQQKGFDVFVSDMSEIKTKYREELERQGIAYEEKQHTEALILNADEVIKSPGIPETAPLIKKLRTQGTHIISEIEFAARYTNAKTICITGSNGKTTTTMLSYFILKNAGLNVGLAGNVGRSFAWQVAECNFDYYVLELSSFQLDGMYDFKADVSILLNITPDHLDRYDYKFQNYIDSKFRILQNQSSTETFIYWSEDPVVKNELSKRTITARMCALDVEKREGNVAYISQNELHINDLVMPQKELSLQGTHNIYNSMAAAIAAQTIGVKNEVIRQSLATFQGVEHRLEYVATVRGVRYINDSKATNVNSCWYALQSMKTPTILILGGKDKGNDYSEIEQLVCEKVSAIVCMGLHNEKIIDFFKGKCPAIFDTHSIEDAIAQCASVAKEGDTVLLSPCCASFDLFSSYEDRGQQFKKCVNALL